MTTQVVFNIESKLKELAMTRARREGIPFSAVLTRAAKAYAEGALDIEAVPKKIKTFVPTAREIKELRQAEANHRAGRYYPVEQVKRELGITH